MRLVLRVALASAAFVAGYGAEPRVVAIGDVHGDLNAFVWLLQSAGLTDSKGKWTGGDSVLVQLGDVPDRGPDTRKVLDLLMDLEKEAGKQGGRVYPLVGNHEAMNIYGDLRYVTPAEFDAFRTSGSRQLREEVFRTQLQEMIPRPADPDAYRVEWEERHPPGWVEHRLAMGPNGKYGKWMRSNPAVCKVGSSLFVHGGISGKYLDWPIERLNGAVRNELGDFSLLRGGVTVDAEGPLWYRGLAQAREPDLAAHVDAVLKKHGVKRIVTGHTIVPGAILPRFGGKVVLADVGISNVYGGRRACVLIEGDSVAALHRGRRIPLPRGPMELLEYLREAASLDPRPSPLSKLIQAVTAGKIPAAY